MENFHKIHFIIYTNDYNISLSQVSLEEFLKNSPKDTKIKVLTNNIPENIILNRSDLFYNANIKQKEGKQFSEVILNFLKKIDEDYVLFNCDDYIVNKKIEKSDFNKLIDFMDFYNVDYFSFDKMKSYSDISTFTIFENKFYENGLINIIPNDHFYRYSVQPCIWKRSSLIELLEKFQEISVHDLETHHEIRKTNYLTLGVNWNKFGDLTQKDFIYDSHFCYSTVEVIRSGVFIHSMNGFPVNESDYVSITINKLIDKYNMCDSSNFDKIMYNMKYGYCKNNN